VRGIRASLNERMQQNSETDREREEDMIMNSKRNITKEKRNHKKTENKYT